MKHRLQLARGLFNFILVLATGPAAKAGIIYSDLNMNGGWTVWGPSLELGDQISASGSDRFVTRLSIEIYSQGQPFPNPINIPPGFADFRAAIYANNGSLGQPGSMLWQSPAVHVNYPPGLTLLNFDVPQVLVPDTFTWTLLLTNPSAIQPGMPTVSSPSVGTVNLTWFGSPGFGWSASSEDGYHLAAQIEAVPEPGVAIICLAGIAVWKLRREKPGSRG